MDSEEPFHQTCITPCAGEAVWCHHVMSLTCSCTTLHPFACMDSLSLQTVLREEKTIFTRGNCKTIQQKYWVATISGDTLRQSARILTWVCYWNHCNRIFVSDVHALATTAMCQMPSRQSNETDQRPNWQQSAHFACSQTTSYATAYAKTTAAVLLYKTPDCMASQHSTWDV